MKVLNPFDCVGVSFWLYSIAMVAATAFFFIERDRAAGPWKTLMTLVVMCTGIAALNAFYLREVWVSTQQVSIVYRYLDWVFTFPLCGIVFYLLLSMEAVVSVTLFWRLFMVSLAMSAFGFLGELDAVFDVGGDHLSAEVGGQFVMDV